MPDWIEERGADTDPGLLNGMNEARHGADRYLVLADSLAGVSNHDVVDGLPRAHVTVDACQRDTFDSVTRGPHSNNAINGCLGVELWKGGVLSELLEPADQCSDWKKQALPITRPAVPCG